MKWTVIGAPYKKGKSSYVTCRCICGAVKDVRMSSLGRDSFSCKKCSNATRTHGLTTHPLYRRWKGMIQRCESDGIGKDLYKDRGISVCPLWRKDFKKFFDWAVANGFEESLTIERIDNDKGYSPENCRWVTPFEQNRNQRTNITITHDGESLILKDWCAKLGINYGTVRDRVRRGSTYKKALGLE